MNIEYRGELYTYVIHGQSVVIFYDDDTQMMCFYGWSDPAPEDIKRLVSAYLTGHEQGTRYGQQIQRDSVLKALGALSNEL